MSRFLQSHFIIDTVEQPLDLIYLDRRLFVNKKSFFLMINVITNQQFFVNNNQIGKNRRNKFELPEYFIPVKFHTVSQIYLALL